ncbi:MAG TPA: hypothetical protein VGG75_39620 [Trebonia sp.]|jgi:hypothetical protein
MPRWRHHRRRPGHRLRGHAEHDRDDEQADLDVSKSWPIVELYSLDCQSATDCEALGSGAGPTSASWPADSDPRSVSAFGSGSDWETVTTP